MKSVEVRARLKRPLFRCADMSKSGAVAVSAAVRPLQAGVTINGRCEGYATSKKTISAPETRATKISNSIRRKPNQAAIGTSSKTTARPNRLRREQGVAGCGITRHRRPARKATGATVAAAKRLICWAEVLSVITSTSGSPSRVKREPNADTV